LALMQGGAGISKDLPPFCVSYDNNRLAGLNVVGLRRAGYSIETRLELRRIYHALLRSPRGLAAGLEAATPLVQSEAGRAFVEFVKTSRRGVVDSRAARGAEAGSSE